MREKDEQNDLIKDLVERIKSEIEVLNVGNFDERRQKVSDLIISVQRLNSDKIVELKPSKELIRDLLESFVELQSKVQVLRAQVLKLSNDSFDEEQLLKSMG